MIAQRKTFRKRRSEVLALLAGEARRSGAFRRKQGSVAGRDEGSSGERLRRVLIDLGPTFASYGLYLSSRGDLLTTADRECLAGIGRRVTPLPPSAVRAIVRAEAVRSPTAGEPSEAPDGDLASLDAEPFDTRLLIQRHYGRLTTGGSVVVRVVRPERAAESDVELIPLLRDAVAPLLSDGRLFARSVDDFRASYAVQTDGHALADALEILGHDSRNGDAMRVPGVLRRISTARVLVMERLPGRRLGSTMVGEGRADGPGGEAAAEDRRAGDGPGQLEGPARLLCDLWLRQAFDDGLVATDLRPENVIVQGRSRIAVDEGTFAVLPHETRQNLLKYLVAVGGDEPRKALDCLLREFEATRHRAPIDRLDRLFRQMIPDAPHEGRSDEPTGGLAATVQAQWRLAVENGYRPLRHGLPLLRGIVRLDETVRALSPGSDALFEGLKDYRLSRLLGDVHEMFEPLYWMGRADRIAALIMSSPRILDEAIAAAVPDRAADERKTPPPRGRRIAEMSWIVPSLVAMAVLGLTHGRVLSAADSPWGEVTAAILFLLLGRWLLGNIGAPAR